MQQSNVFHSGLGQSNQPVGVIVHLVSHGINLVASPIQHWSTIRQCGQKMQYIYLLISLRKKLYLEYDY